MCRHVHQIIHLNIHMIANRSEPFIFRTNHLSTLLLTFQDELPSFMNLRVITMVLLYLECLYASSPWFWGGPLLLRRRRGVSVGKRGEGERTNLWPSRMKVLSPLPWLVELALLPSMMVSAGNAAQPALLRPLPFQVASVSCICGHNEMMCLLSLCPTKVNSCRNQWCKRKRRKNEPIILHGWSTSQYSIVTGRIQIGKKWALFVVVDSKSGKKRWLSWLSRVEAGS